DPRDQQTVPSGRRVVVIAVEQNLIDGRANLLLRRFHKPQPQITRGITDAVEVARDFAGGREQHDSAGMRELAGGGVIGVAEAYGLRESFDLHLVSGEEVPSARAPGAAVESGIKLVFYVGKKRAF